ncbi:PQQ-dependent sugar dehydrogenase [Candidatus Dojkabacteria bacterium]|nr:PQQ-dependent sugar dehydrogenase [Candidatus Dojkabacteria bacterium]
MEKKKSNFPVLHFLIFQIIALGLGYIYFNPPVFRKVESQEQKQLFDVIDKEGYEAIEKDKFEVSIFASNIPSISSIAISPDDKYMLASSLDGDITAFVRQGENLVRQAVPFFSLGSLCSGFPEEYGLTGITFSVDFEKSRELFLFYSEKNNEDKIFNKVGKIIINEESGVLTGVNLTTIFTANIEGGSSHQIQKGISTLVSGKPHVMFAIGDGFNSAEAQDKSLESGKIILIQADGSNPLGSRPYPKSPRIQAIGIRNAPGLAIDSFDPDKRVIILDTGPDKYDRFIYSNLLSNNRFPNSGNNLGWDGTTASLQRRISHPDTDSLTDMVLHRWNQTVTPTNIEVHKGKGAIPASDEKSTSVLISYFGVTASPTSVRGKQIALGIITRGIDKSVLSLSPIIERSNQSDKYYSNPLGLAVEKSGNFYFGDIIEGRIYKVVVK